MAALELSGVEILLLRIFALLPAPIILIAETLFPEKSF